MEVIEKTAILAEKISLLRQAGKTAGFVPTMGALHEGHLSLVRFCRQQNKITVVSIFVNPTQFNDKSDLERYPRMPEKDLKLLKTAGCDLVFLPDEKEIYPETDTRVFDFEGLDEVMEGRHRPGHFNGVAQVVTRLFDIVKPDRAYFGLKDFQQVAIIRKVVKNMQLPVEIVACPIVRECDGLAMSSRNMLLTKTERKKALVLSHTLFKAKAMKDSHTPDSVTAFVIQQINAAEGVDLEYFEIVDGMTLQPATSWDNENGVIGCIAARVGKIRLIDNIEFSS
ncbi:MAG: pantoate--beta-alanine ligase [Bacteroidales bacterium]|nr:pantoate--beta-alanine ligase [Bacteroidales bacterium]